MEMMIERRGDAEGRIPIQLPIELGVGDPMGGFEGDSLDVSTGGLALRADSVPPVGTQLACRFAVQPGGARVKVLGRVVWAAPERDGRGQFGLRFMNLLPEHRALISEMLAEHVAHGHFERQVEHDIAEELSVMPLSRPPRRDTEQLFGDVSSLGDTLSDGDDDPGLDAAFADDDLPTHDEVTAVDDAVEELMVVPQGQQPMRLTAEVEAAFVEADETFPDDHAGDAETGEDEVTEREALEAELDPAEVELEEAVDEAVNEAVNEVVHETPAAQSVRAASAHAAHAAQLASAKAASPAEVPGVAASEQAVVAAPTAESQTARLPDTTALLRFDPGLSEVEGWLTDREGDRARFEQPLDMLALGQGLLMSAYDGQVSRARIAAVSVRVVENVPQLNVELELEETDEPFMVQPRPSPSTAPEEPQHGTERRELRFRGDPTVTEFDAPRLGRLAEDDAVVVAAQASKVTNASTLETARAEDVQLMEPGADQEADDGAPSFQQAAYASATKEPASVESGRAEAENRAESDIAAPTGGLVSDPAETPGSGDSELHLSAEDATPYTPGEIELPPEPEDDEAGDRPALSEEDRSRRQVALVKSRKALTAVGGAVTTAGRLGRTAYITARLVQQRMSTAAADSPTLQGLKQRVAASAKKKRTAGVPVATQNAQDSRRRLILTSYAAFGLFMVLALLALWLWPSGDDIEPHREVSAEQAPVESEQQNLPPVAERTEGRHYLEQSAVDSSQLNRREEPQPITARYGDKDVPNPKHFTLRMTGNIRRLRGSRDRGGFQVTIPGVHSFDPARPLAAAHAGIDDSIILNRGNRAELTVRFVSGQRPAFRVYATGAELHIEVEQK